MAKPILWESKIDGQTHSFAYQYSKALKKQILTVDGVDMPFEKKWQYTWMGTIDEPFELNGRQARFVLVRKKPDIVLNGTYVRSGKAYVPIPSWGIVFMILSLTLILGGAIGAIFAVLSAALCQTVSTIPECPSFLRVILCIGILILAWIAYIIVAGGFLLAVGGL